MSGSLMTLLVEEARRRGARRLLLAVYSRNEKARRFYERRGFREIGETTFTVGNVPFSDLVSALTL